MYLWLCRCDPRRNKTDEESFKISRPFVRALIEKGLPHRLSNDGQHLGGVSEVLPLT